MREEELPDPQTEWEDALQRIEILVWKAERDALVAAGSLDAAARERYQALGTRLAVLQNANLR